jgi:membrane protein
MALPEQLRQCASRIYVVVLAYTEDMRQHDVLLAASAIAFHAFFSLVPLVAITGWIAHEVTSTREQVLQPLLRVAPGPVAALADGEFMRLGTGGQAVLAPLSIIGFIWLASGGASVAMGVFELIFDARPRPWLKRRLLAVFFVLAAVVLLLLASGAVVLAVWLGSTAALVAGIAVPLLALWLLVAGFFRHATIRKGNVTRRGFYGALVTLVLWFIVSLGFSFYARQLASYSQFYGSVAAVVIVLLWLWLMAFALLIGGEVNAHVEGVRDVRRSR